MPTPPRLPLRFFRWFCHPELRKYIEGDLLELYGERCETDGKSKAGWKFTWEVLKLFRPGIIRPIEGHKHLNTYGMYKSYFKIGWRNLLRNKGYSFINIGGLALGLAVALLLGLWVYDEWSFNSYFQNRDNIAQVYRSEVREGEIDANTFQVPGLGTLLQQEYGAHFDRVVMMRAGTEDRIIAFGENKFTQSGYFMQDQGPDMFSLKMIEGSRDGLKDMKSILLSKSLADKLFGGIDPLNQVITMDARFDLTVTGVYEDFPNNTEFSDATYFAPLDLYVQGAPLTAWNNYFMRIYLQKPSDADFEELTSLIKDVTLPHISEEEVRAHQQIFLHPMREWHLNSEFENGVLITSKRMLAVWYFSAIGAFVLLLACINFMNLSTARTEKRAKEVGIRKSIGSLRNQLVQQFYGESFLVAFIAFIFAIVIVQLSLPWFNSISDKHLVMPWSNPFFGLICLGLVLVAGLLAGSYPALYLSSFKPVSVLKGAFKSSRAGGMTRRILVVVQFTVSIALAIGTIIMYQQIQFAKDRPVGYSRNGLIELRSASKDFKGKYEVLRQELKQTGVVTEIAEANYSVTDTRGWNGGFSWNGKEIAPTFNTIFVTSEYGKTVGLEFVAGRDFSREIASDSMGIIVNESALALMNIPEPVGESLRWNPGGDPRGTYQIVGVVKDMIKGSPYEPTLPTIMFRSRRDLSWLYVRIDAETSPHDALPKIGAVLTSLIPSAPFDYTFVDQAYAAKFRAEERMGGLATFFSVVAILISCLGLFGLAAYTAEQRTKEIGLRKVLGASTLQVWELLSRDFAMLVILACGIASAVAYYFMNNWLLQYEYRIEMSWKIFVMAGLGGLFVTLLTVSFQSIRAATMNPVESLKQE